MSTMTRLFLTFVCGAAYELACVFWVRTSERKQAWPATGWSAFAALVTCIGLGEALHDPIMIAAYVAGFASGTHVAIRIQGAAT